MDEFQQGLILPPLIVQLRKILEQYPDDTQILKELIQNAEDAGASEVKFLYDRRTHSKDPKSLEQPGLVDFQGPSLYAYNNGVFDEDDWRGIRMLSQSVKQHDRTKVGYFGMGFKSVFHLTDLPFIVSGDRVGVIDPQQIIFSQNTYSWSFKDVSSLLNTKKKQFEPFLDIFDCTESSFKSGQYNKTLFRFPLRNKASSLSEKIYTDERMVSLFDCFEEDSHLILLFLKNLERVELYERDTYDKKAKLMFEVKLSDDCIELVRLKRRQFIRDTKSGNWMDHSLVSSFPITIETIRYEKSGGQRKSYKYLVTHLYCGGHMSTTFKRLCHDPDLHNSPWVGTAMSLDTSETQAGPLDGHVFCFLPLPFEQKSLTGLPVHLNGFFALEHNRKYVKWPSLYRTVVRDELVDKRLLWNQCLVKEALPKAYTEMILHAIKMSSNSDKTLSPDVIYKAFPDLSKVERKWEAMLLPLFAELFSKAVILTKGESPEWQEVKDVILDNLDINNQAHSVIEDILEHSNTRIANIPPHVYAAVKRYYRYSTNQITHALVSSTFREVQHQLSLQWETKMHLLRYFLKDFKYDMLEGLDLLPLANGGFQTFYYSAKRADRPIYIPTKTHPQSILPNLQDDFIDPEIEPDIMDFLIRGARRGYTQLQLLSSEAVIKELPRCLPSSWLNSSLVEWDPEQSKHPPDTWLPELWQFLARQCGSDLSPFEKLPIVPVKVTGQKKELASLGDKRALICKEFDGISLESKVVSILENLGVTIIEELPSYVKAHPLTTRKYTFTPTHIGVLKSIIFLSNIEGLKATLNKVAALDADEKRCLRLLFSKIYPHELKADYRDVLKHLPLFETMKEDDKPSSFVSCVDVNLAAPRNLPPIPLSQKMLDVTGTDSQHLAALLDVTLLNEVELLTSVVFADIENGFYEPHNVQDIMMYVLKNFYIFQEMSSHFKDILKSLPFIMRKDLFVPPYRFYDPDHELLQTLFLTEEQNFPHGVYSDSAIVSILREIGLRGPREMEPEDLLESAYVVQDLSESNQCSPSQISAKSDAIMEYLTKYPDILDIQTDGGPLSHELANIKWVKVQSRKTPLYPLALRWFASDLPNPSFQKPKDVTSNEYAELTGSIQPVVSIETSSPVAKHFAWNKGPELPVIVEHFYNIVQCYAGSEKAKYTELVSGVYEALTRSEVNEVLEALDRQGLEKWVWHGDGFCGVQQAVFEECFMDLSPFIFNIPNVLQPLQEFFKSCGVKETCCLTYVLKQVQQKYALETQVSEAEAKRDLHICVSVLNELKTNLTDEGLSAMKQELVVPVHTPRGHTLRLEPILNCSYCDEEWLRQGRDLSDLADLADEKTEEEPLLVHPNVPSSTSEALGVPTLMSRVLEAEELDFRQYGGPFLEGFGQSDSLTHRLHTLLQDYTDGFAVPKELVQNADDAGATEVLFLYDERQNEDALTCLIDEGMRECQGPALWAYNDAVFTDDDFDNICKLSGATKESQTDKIGRFGLGFNAVYNLTDVPSFVSRHNIVIFDPHTTHLGRSIKNKSKPGIKIDMRKHRRKLRRIGNQFKPYNDIFGCDLRPDAEVEEFDGTLFRFPLRTRSQASRSEICDKHYDDMEMKALLKMLVENAESLLLFTQSVCKIALYHIPAHTGSRRPRPVELMRVEKKAVSVVRELLPKMASPPTASKLSDDMKEMIQQSSILKAASSVMHSIKLGFNIASLQLPSASQLIEVECRVTEGATGKLGLARNTKIKQWLVSSHMGRGPSLQMAASQTHLIPCAGVAVPVTKSSEQDTYTPSPLLSPHYPCPPSGSVFSYMPLPVQSGLPVHINGAFAISSSRRHLCEKNEDDKFDTRALWNETLMKDAVCEAYMNLLTDLTVIAPPTECGYPGVWPNLSHVESAVSHLGSEFYSRLVSSDCTLFCDGGHWKNFKDTMILSPELESHSTSFSATTLRVARLCLKESQNIVIYLPEFVRRALQSSGHGDCLTKHTSSTEHFYRELFLPHIHRVDGIDRDTLVLQALSINDHTVLGLLRGSACIPVTPKGQSLKRPAELIDPASELSLLFSAEDEAFPYGVFQERNTLEVLRGLGLKADKLSWSETVQCARSLETAPYQAASKRIPVLLKQLERAIHGCDNEKDIKDKLAVLQDIRFLQPMRRPAYFPFEWQSCSLGEQALLSPRQLYHPVHVDTVCLTEPILDLSTIPTECVSAIDCLNMTSKEPHIDSVLKQLEILADTDNESCLTDTRIFKDVHRICMAVYELLQYRCEDPDVKQKVLDRLQSRPFILAHGRFLFPTQLAFEFTQNCPPYLYSVPDTLRKNYNKFLRMMGVRDHFEASDYVHALQDMRSKYGEEPLKRDALKIALQLVNLLNEVMTELDQSLHDVTEGQGTIYIPDAQGVLQPSQELCFNEPDVNWVPSSDFTAYSHPHIPFTISKQLGVSTKRHDVLTKHSHGIAFGQKERLTNRIRRILSGYPCDKEILKEMLQNADDAQASEIHFINDPRQHRTERVFDESWKPLQGPALCVFNDKAFSEADITGIQRLGEGSKSLDPNKTGQYGVGFNCIYHLTDAPSFLTATDKGGHSLCVFDPHGKYVPGATSEEPGRRYDDVGELRRIFTDIFPCYLEDQFPVHQGTMFRFPLRTAEMAEVSELSDIPVTSRDVSNLFSKFRTEMFDCLLFVNHVKSITLTEMDKLTGRVSSTYTVCAELSQQDTKLREEFAQFITDITAKVKEGKMQVWNIPSKEVTYTLDIADSQGYSEKWLVHQKVGFEEGTEITASLIDALKRKDLSMLPRGGCAALLERTGHDPSQQRVSKAFCFLPLPLKTSLPININGHFALDHEARRNLWTDDDKSPKSEWNLLLLQHVIGPAYVRLLREMPAYISTSCPSPNVSLMEEVEQQVPSIDTYSSMFPRMNHSDPYWRALTKAVYQHIHNFQVPVLPIVKSSTVMDLSESQQAEVEWMTTTGVGSVKPYFDSLESEDIDDLSVSLISSRRRLTSTPKRKLQSDQIKEALIRCGLKLVHLPLDIYRCFVDAGVPVECLSPEVVVDFFKGYRLPGTTCTLGSLPTGLDNSPFRDEEALNRVLMYCMRNDDYLVASLEGLPLLLTEDKQIREFRQQNPVYLTSFTDLLPECGSQFIHHRIVNGAFQSLTPGHSDILERFDVYAFAGLLPNVLSTAWYKKESEHAIWIEEEDQLPNREWICKVWDFLRSEFDRILSLQQRVDSQEELLKGIVRPLEEWALLPAYLSEEVVTSTPHKRRSYKDSIQEVKQLYLVPLGLAHTALDFSQTSVTNYTHRAALRNLGIPEMHSTIIDGGNLSPHGKNVSPTASNANLARLLVANMEKPITILQSLAYAFDMGNLGSRLKPEDCNLILKYLSDCTDSWKDQKECVLMLRDLPMFLSVHGDFVKIGGSTAYVLPSDIPQIDLEIWEEEAQVIFLRKNSSVERLYSSIGCISLSATQMYSQFTFQNFGRLSPEGRIRHLEFIRDIKLPQLTGEERESFTGNLQNLRFLEKDGSFKCASEYYDPYNSVFKAMLANDPSAFPPKPFCEFKWLDFMKAVGLQQEVTKEQFVEFAQKVADEASTNPSESTFNKSRTLVTHLFHRPNLAVEDILTGVADIPFIPVSKVNSMLSKIYSPLAQQNGLTDAYIRFSEGIPENHEALVWSSCHLIPDWANPFKINSSEVSWNYDFSNIDLCDFQSYMREVARLLGVKEEPDVSDVLQHTKNICSNMFSKHSGADDLKVFMKVDVMKMIYKFLQGNACNDEMTKELLGKTDCLLVDLGYTFVRPNQVVIDLYEEDQIAPYLYKLPTELGEFKNLFLHLGATEHATPEQYAMVLENMFRQTLGAKLHPNEMRTAFKAVKEIFTSLQRHPVDDLNIDMLFLPSSSGKLQASVDLTFNNFQGYSERISQFDKPFLVDLSECGLSSKMGTFEDLVKLLPKRLRPPKLTTVVSENLEDISRTSVVSHGICDKVKHQINSRAFAQGIVRLIKHEHHRSGHRVKKEVLDRIQNKLKNVKVYGVETLITYLIHSGERIAESESQCECFAEKEVDGDGTEIWTLYIDNSLSMNEELLVGVAEFVNRVSGGLLNHSVHYLQPILSCSPHSIYRILDRLKIRPDHSIDFKQPTLPTPGSFVPIEDHHLLNEDFNHFEPGEYVGYELSDDETGGQTFVYAIIIEKMKLDETDADTKLHLMQIYRINVGDERKLVEAVATDLYKFHRVEGFVSRHTSALDGQDRLHSYSRSPHSPLNSFRDSYSSNTTSFSESFFEPTTPKTPKARQKPQKDEVFSSKSDDAKGEVFIDADTPGRMKQKASTVTTDGVDFGRTNGKHEEEQPEPEGYFEKYMKMKAKDAAKQAAKEEAEAAGTEAEEEVSELADEGEEVDGAEQPDGKKDKAGGDDESQTVEELLEEISDVLEEAWLLQQGQRKKVIKRLLLKWHPDKNLGNERLATMVTQHIQAEIERLEQGLPRPAQFDDLINQFSFDPRNPFTQDAKFQANFYKSYKYFYEQVNERAKEHKKQRERYKEFFSKEYSSSRNFSFDVPPTFSSSNPQPNHAKRFLKQAQEDLRSTDNDYDAKEPSYEWACFKAHQAAEKALKAAQFSVDAQTSFNHDLGVLAATLEDLELRRLAMKLQRIIGNTSKLYNPDPIDFVIIPHEEYSQEMACDAVMCATDILERVKEFVDLRE